MTTKKTNKTQKSREEIEKYLFNTNFRYEQIQAMKSTGQIHIKFVEEEKEILRKTEEFLAKTLSQREAEVREKVNRKIEDMRKLHTHDSIPLYTGEEDGDEGKCIICQRNVVINSVLSQLKNQDEK